MKERLQHHLSDVGESFDYLRSDVRNLSRSMAELEELAEAYRTFVTSAQLSNSPNWAMRRKLLKRTHKILGPSPSQAPASRSSTSSKSPPLMRPSPQKE